jgi:hypothetical protein
MGSSKVTVPEKAEPLRAKGGKLEVTTCGRTRSRVSWPTRTLGASLPKRSTSVATMFRVPPPDWAVAANSTV